MLNIVTKNLVIILFTKIKLGETVFDRKQYDQMFDPPSTKKRSPPPWQVIDQVAHYLDPTTLAISCCVSKTWSFSMSNDHLWQPICTLTYPSLSNLHVTANLPYHKLYSLGRSADTRLRKPPPKPRLSMLDCIFAIDIRSNNETVASFAVPGKELEIDRNGIFRFDVDVGPGTGRKGGSVVFGEMDSLRITWNVVLEGYKRVFTMMDCKGKGNFVLGLEGWFSKELPVSGCCSGGGGSGLVAELRLGLKEGGGKVEVGKMSVGVLNVMSWRYVLVDDCLRYLQHFLLPI